MTPFGHHVCQRSNLNFTDSPCNRRIVPRASNDENAEVSRSARWQSVWGIYRAPLKSHAHQGTSLFTRSEPMMNLIALVDPNRVALGIILSSSRFPSESSSNSRSVPSWKSVLLFLIQTISGPTMAQSGSFITLFPSNWSNITRSLRDNFSNAVWSVPQAPENLLFFSEYTDPDREGLRFKWRKILIDTCTWIR